MLWGAIFCHTDLGQNIVFHNFAIQIALIKSSGWWKHAWTFSETVKNISKITYTASRISLWQAPKEWTITELRLNIIKNLLCLFFIYWLYNWMCNLQKRLMRAAFWVLLQAMFTNDWKQTAQRLKLQGRLLTIKKYKSVKHIPRQKFSFTKTSIKVSLKIPSLQA